MSIYRTAINKPVTTALIFVALFVIGIFSYQRLPIDQFPEIDPPYITVMTTYPGANASEIETNVTELLENSLNSVEGLEEITSTTEDNISIIILELDWETDMNEVINDVRSFLDMTKDELPEGAGTPFIFKFSSSSMPVIQYAITAEGSYPGLEKILNDEIIPVLNRVSGVGNISLSGAPERRVYVEIDQQKIDAYGLSLEMVGQAVSANNLNLSSGTVKMDKEQYQLQVRSEYLSSSEIEDIVVSTTQQGRQIFVRDIAIVRDTIKDLTLDEKANGRESVRLMVSKQSGANTVQICDEIRVVMEDVLKTMPQDIEATVIYDSSDDIKGAVNSLQQSIFWALLFVVLVVFVFLGKWRATVIIAVAIPIALVSAFIYLLYTGSSLNIISLSSLTIAVGMVVDDAIVVLENITRHIERGSSPREAAIYATNEVWVSVIATTLVLVAVFVPLTMLSGMEGILFKELGWIVTIVITISTIIAITLTPMLCSKLLKAKKVKIDENGQIQDVKEKVGWYEKYVVGFLDKVDKQYAKLLAICLKNKAATIIVAVLIFVSSLIPMLTGQIGSDFMQQTDNARLTVKVELQRGTRIEETLKTAREIEQSFMTIAPEIRIISTSAGTDDQAGISSIFSQTNNNTIEMTIACTRKEERERTVFELAEVLRQDLERYPEVIDYQCNVSSGFGPQGANTVDVDIYGYDFDQTNIVAAEVKALIEQNIPSARDIDITRDDDRAELKVVVDKEKLAMHGLNSATVSSYVRNRVYGMSSGFLKEDGDEYDILVRVKEKDRNSLTDITNLTIPTATGKMIKLSEVATVEEYWTPPTIDRKNRQRYLSVKVTPYKISLGEMAAQIEELTDSIELPAGVIIRFSGQYQDQQESFADMSLLLALIVFLVFVVMASQFESLSRPFVIMFSVPFAITGVILALWITGTSLDIIGILGVIMLVGIVVKNGIVLVDYINLMRDRGHKLDEAITISGASRLRPVLMTAFTTVLGMLPMAMSTGEGAEMWRPMGVVVIGGLLVSTFVTLVIVPIMYAIISRSGDRRKEEKRRKEFVFMKLNPNQVSNK